MHHASSRNGLRSRRPLASQATKKKGKLGCGKSRTLLLIGLVFSVLMSLLYSTGIVHMYVPDMEGMVQTVVSSEYATMTSQKARRTSDPCSELLEDDSYLFEIANAVVREFLSNRDLHDSAEVPNIFVDANGVTYTPPTRDQLHRAEDAWMRVMEACHGPLPSDSPDLRKELSAMKWMERLDLCRVMSGLGTGEELCMAGWATTMNSSDVDGKIADLVEWFLFTARCGLHLEFPLSPSEKDSMTPTGRNYRPPPTIREQRPGWRPKRVVVVTIGMGRIDASAACMVINTAFSRGLDVVVAEGTFRGLQHKFEYALHTMELALLSNPDVAEDDTLVMFIDADSVVQQGPDYLIDSFLNQPYPFLWGSEQSCFPLTTWPHGLIEVGDLCKRLFPETPLTEPGLVYGQKYLNAGGWISLAPSARKLLDELVDKVRSSSESTWPKFSHPKIQHIPPKTFCYERGTDQLLAQTSFLRNRDWIGLDSRSVFVANDPRPHIGSLLNLAATKDKGFPAWCYDATANGRLNEGDIPDMFDPCPAALHFNGASSNDVSMITAFEGVLGRSRAVWKDTCSNGTLTIVNLDTGKVQRNVQFDGIKRRWPCEKSPIPPCNTEDSAEEFYVSVPKRFRFESEASKKKNMQIETIPIAFYAATSGNFVVHMNNTAPCAQFLEDDSYLLDIANVIVRKWLSNREADGMTGVTGFVDNNGKSYIPPVHEELHQAEENWMRVVEACHGPLPSNNSALLNDLTAMKWMERLDLCRAMSEQGTGEEVCAEGWATALNSTNVDGRLDDLAEWFVFTGRCGLHFEFPVSPYEVYSLNKAGEKVPPPPIREQRPGWRPQRVLVVAIAMGEIDASSSCMLVNTAFSRGLEVVVAEGTFRGLQHKFQYTLHAMEMALSLSDVADDDTLVIFTDATDSVVQQGPDYLIDNFMDQPYLFLWGSEHSCFPLTTWPNGLLEVGDLCKRLFPETPREKPGLVYEQRYVNAGGWIGMASAARNLLNELTTTANSASQSTWPKFSHPSIKNTPPQTFCYERGTDQLLAQSSFLRNRDRIGLDTQSLFVANDARTHVGGVLNLNETKDEGFPAWCYDVKDNGRLYMSDIPDTFDPCPAVLHFNGAAKDDDDVLTGFRRVLGSDHLVWKDSCSNGTLTIVNLDTGRVQRNVQWNDSKREWPCEKPPLLPCETAKSAEEFYVPIPRKYRLEKDEAVKETEIIPVVAFLDDGNGSSIYEVDMNNTASCAEFLEEEAYLLDIADVIVRAWLSTRNADGVMGASTAFDNREGTSYVPPSREELRAAEDAWMRVMEACHGPLPSKDRKITTDLSGMKWMERLDLCRAMSEHGTGAEVCMEGWATALNSTTVDGKLFALVKWFVYTAQCGLHLEFPMSPYEVYSLTATGDKVPALPIREQRPGWKPQRVVVVAVAMGESDASSACMLVNTAFSRGLEVVVAEGEERSWQHKFQYGLRALDLALSYSDVADDDTLVLFTDSSSSVLQQGAAYLIDNFLNQPYSFVWASEQSCFPLKTWPHGVAGVGVACERLFPKAPRGQPGLTRDRRYLNTDGWIGVASAARTLIHRLDSKLKSASTLTWPKFSHPQVESVSPQAFCYEQGTGQLLAQSSFLRYRDRIGLDTQSIFFSADPLVHIDSTRLQLASTKTEGFPAWCYRGAASDRNTSSVVRDDFDPCPAMLHLGSGSQLMRGVCAHAVLGPKRPVWFNECSTGSLTVVNLDTGRVQRDLQLDDWPCEKSPVLPCAKSK